jgi:serine/threonine protein kinase
MPTATLPQVWRGRSGREYVPAEQARVRHGGMATVRKVVGRGPQAGTSTAPQGAPLALKLWNESEESSLDQLQAEARILVEISQVRVEEALPCPRLYDLVGDPLVVGLVMEWCPADLERWWRDKLKEPDAFGRLMATMAEAARRVSDYHVFFATRRGLDTAHGDLKPTNILLSQQGRWLISDFGAARVRPPDDNPLVTSKVVAGTENFLAPEALFHAKRRFPPAMDTWALGATAFALLRLQRMVLDETALPRNGTQSPRFRMQRISQVHEVYGRDPTRFFDKDLDADAFPDALKLPEEDRRAVRDALRGAFGRPDDKREDELARETVDVLERAMSIEPKYRYTDARDLAAAFERLTRVYIELSSSPEPADTAVLVRLRDEAADRAKGLEEQLSELREQLAAAQARTDAAEEARRTAEVAALAAQSRERVVPVGPPRWWSFALVVLVGFQALTLLLVVGMAAVQMWLAGR